MSPKVLALYRTAPLVLIAFVLAAACQGQWTLAFYALLIRSALWWIALPYRRLRTGGTFGEVWGSKMREVRREMEISRLALQMVYLPLWANLWPRIILMGPPIWLLHDPVASALLRHGKKAGPRLLELARSSDPDVRASAARALRELKPAGHQEALDALRDDPYDRVKAASLTSAQASAIPASDPLLRLVALPNADAASEDLVDSLRRTFDAMAPGEKEDVVRRLGETQGEPAIAWLLELGKPDSEVGTMARKALLEVDDPRVSDLFFAHAERKPESFIGLIQLQKRDDPRVEALLLRRLNSERRTTRVMALSLLGKVPTETARFALHTRLGDKRGWIRLRAAESLAMHAAEPEPLRGLARSWNPICRYFARKTLRKINGRNG